jgi:RHS repeat-associated protein
MGVTTYSNAFGSIVSETRSGVESTYVPDTLGSTVGLIDVAGTLTDSWKYWPYGEIVNHNGTSVTPFTYVGTLGYRQDIVGSLTYVRARHLDPSLAGWQTADPYWPDEPAYEYSGGRPSFEADPTGKQGAEDAGGQCTRRVPTRPRTPAEASACKSFCGSRPVIERMLGVCVCAHRPVGT